MSKLFRTFVLSRLWLTFLVLGASFLVFGACTVNLGFLLMANLRLLTEYGWQAAMDGGLEQLLRLVATGYVGVSAYVVLKTCEHRLSDWLAGRDHASPAHPAEDDPGTTGNGP
jgi:hypothetical protein